MSDGVQNPIRIMTIGDSITDHGNAFRHRLGELLKENEISYSFVGSRGFRIKHEGHSGATTSDIQRSISSWIQKQQPDIVLLMIGTNDVWRKLPLEIAIQNINQSVEAILTMRPRTQVFLAKILPMEPEPDNVLLFNELLAKIFENKILANKFIHIVDMFSGFEIDSDLKDGVHPNSVGYKKMGERWFQDLQKVL